MRGKTVQPSLDSSFNWTLTGYQPDASNDEPNRLAGDGLCFWLFQRGGMAYTVSHD